MSKLRLSLNKMTLRRLDNSGLRMAMGAVGKDTNRTDTTNAPSADPDDPQCDVPVTAYGAGCQHPVSYLGACPAGTGRA
jgi:hypothetical protein